MFTFPLCILIITIELDKHALFEFLHTDPYLKDIVLFALSLHQENNFLMLLIIEKFSPFLQSDEISFALSMGFINCDCPLLINSSKCTDHSLFALVWEKSLFVFHSEPDFEWAFHEKSYFIDIFKFLINQSVLVIMNWLERIHDLEHVTSIFFVSPDVSWMFVFFFKVKDRAVNFHEFLVQKVDDQAIK